MSMLNHSPIKKGRWIIPAAAVGFGLAYLVAGWLGGDLTFGVGGLVLMTVVAAVVLLVSTRSETVKGLLDGQDERIKGIDATATMVAGLVVLMAVIFGFVVEIARGQDGSPYSALAALGGLTYIIALIWLRMRR